METKLQEEINKVLGVFPEYWNGNTLLKNKVIEDIRSYNETIIEALLSNDLIKDTYALELPSALVFKVEDFVSMLRFKNYWDNSYTKYTNEIGLTSESKYLKYNTDVVLDFPHKDSILEGGMIKEDEGKDENFYHNIIAKEEIDTLLSPKVLKKMKKYDANGKHNVADLSDNDNLIIKGNNLLALYTLEKKFKGEIDFIYIDPPYNTKNDSFIYNDNFNISTWLTFMKNRLEIAKRLLSDSGSIFISIDGNQFDYLSLILKDIFGEENLLEVFHFQVRYANKSLNERDDFQPVIEYGFAYAKNKSLFKPNKPTFPYDTSKFKFEIKEIKKPDRKFFLEDGRKVEVFQKGSYTISKVSEEKTKELDYFKETWVTGSIYSDTGHGTMYKRAVEPYREIDGEGSLYKIDGLGEDGLGFRYMTNPQSKSGNYGKMFTKIPSEKKEKILTGKYSREKPIVNFQDISARVGNIRHEGGVALNKGKKPENMLGNLIDIFSNPGDRILDFFLGSGTTAAVAHKKNRKYIGIEQMDYIDDLVVTRLSNVVNGDQTGISKDVEWQGGGSFVYAELYNLNEEYIYAIQTCQNTDELEQVIDRMKQSAYLNFKVDLEKVTTKNEHFKALSLEEQKDVLIQVLDINQLYLNYSEIDDSQYDISDSVKAFNHSFYQKEGDTNE